MDSSYFYRVKLLSKKDWFYDKYMRKQIGKVIGINCVCERPADMRVWVDLLKSNNVLYEKKNNAFISSKINPINIAE